MKPECCFCETELVGRCVELLDGRLACLVCAVQRKLQTLRTVDLRAVVGATG